MTIAQIEENLKGLVKYVDIERFIYGLLLAYGFPKATITRLESGDRNINMVSGHYDGQPWCAMAGNFAAGFTGGYVGAAAGAGVGDSLVGIAIDSLISITVTDALGCVFYEEGSLPWAVMILT